jgi:chromate reductase, NAD(P)H dehydrogenase (quinone)
MIEKERDETVMNAFDLNSGNVKILGIVGSLRENSLNKALLEATARFLPPTVDFGTFDLEQIPHYNQDVEDSQIPEIVRRFKEKVRAAEAVIIASPEYNGSVSGVLKDALDWASRPYGDSSFDGKPVAVIVAVSGRSGGHSAIDHLTKIIDYLDGELIGEPILVQLASRRFGTDGKLSDPEIVAKIQKLTKDIVTKLTWKEIKPTLSTS